MNEEIDRLIVDPYMDLYRIAKEKNLFENEQALQSAVASMYIRYNQLADKNVHFNALLKQLYEESKKRTESLSEDRQPFNEAILDYFGPLMNDNSKVKGYIESKLQKPVYDYSKFITDLYDYLYRNRYVIKHTFSISIREEDD